MDGDAMKSARILYSELPEKGISISYGIGTYLSVNFPSSNCPKTVILVVKKVSASVY